MLALIYKYATKITFLLGMKKKFEQFAAIYVILFSKPIKSEHYEEVHLHSL